MREAGIGRVLVASLHQGIADILPTRLGFYENWLNAEGLREGTIGLAPLYAVLSFLRQEGEAYQMITTRAGEYAAEWTVQSMSPVQRSMIRAAPGWMRRRLLLRLARAPRPQQLSRQPRDLAAAPRHGQRRRARLGLLHGSRAGAPSAVRVLCGGLHAAARAVQPSGARGGDRMPRHGQTDVRASNRDGRRTSDGGRVRRPGPGSPKPASGEGGLRWRRSSLPSAERRPLPGPGHRRSGRPHPRHAVRERETRRHHLLAG